MTVLFMIIGVVVLLAVSVMSVLFFILGKEAVKEEQNAPTGVEQLKKELATRMFEQSKTIENGAEVIPVFTPQVSLPVQPAEKAAIEDDIYKKRAEKLEEELLFIARKADGQSDDAKKMIATLTQENEALKSQKAQWEAAQQRLTKLQDDTSNLKTENAGLQIKLDSAQSELKVLEEQLSAFKIQMGQEIVRANQAIETLKKENATLMAAPKIDPDEGLRREFEALKAEYAELKKKCEAQQYELIKARAQTSGLERVNFNYKNQLEELLKKV